jgi:hypothetical protein
LRCAFIGHTRSPSCRTEPGSLMTIYYNLGFSRFADGIHEYPG